MLPHSLTPTAAPKAQFRAVILCGYGNDLFPLVEPLTSLNESEDEQPSANQPATGASSGKNAPEAGQVKALLPVAGRKMVDWVIDTCEQAGLYDVVILSPRSISYSLNSHIRHRRTSASTSNNSTPSAKIEVEEIPNEIARTGTVNVLLWATKAAIIRSDFVILPCDLIFTPHANSSPAAISLSSIIDRHRTDDNLVTSLFSTRAAGSVVPAAKDGPPAILSVYDSANFRLLDLREMDEFDADEIPLRSSLLRKCPSPTLTTNLLPSIIFVCSREFVNLLGDETHLKRLKRMENLIELFGWLARLHWRNKGKDAVGYRPEHTITRDDGLAMGRSSTQTATGISSNDSNSEGNNFHRNQSFLTSGFQTGANTPALVSRSSFFKGHNSHTPQQDDWETPLNPKGKIRVGAGAVKIVIWREADGFCARGNTIQGFTEINRAALKLVPPSPAPTNTPSGVFISPDSFLDVSVYPNLGDKVGLKRCIIGKGCQIGKGSKLTNCVLMEQVSIGENVKMDNCVVSNLAQIRDRAVLKEVEIGRNVVIETDTTLKNEQLVVEAD